MHTSRRASDPATLSLRTTMQVAAVDYSVLPPSYGIEINGQYRETEGDRLSRPPSADGSGREGADRDPTT